MKKLSLLLLSAIMLITTACTTSNSSNATQTSETTQLQNTAPQTSKSLETVATIQEQSELPIQEDPYQTAGMPQPFEHVGGDANSGFNISCISKINGVGGVIAEYFIEYLGSDELLSRYDNMGNTTSIIPNLKSFMDFPNLFETIMTFDIPNEVVVSAIKEHNEFFTKIYNESYEEFFQYYDKEKQEDVKEVLATQIFSQEDIDVLLTRDIAKVTAHFATDEAIAVEDKVYAPVWLYCHTTEDYEKAGITPEMLEEKLDLYAEFELTNQADEAFSKKLSEFTGKKVSLKQRRAENKNNQVNRKRQ